MIIHTHTHTHTHIHTKRVGPPAREKKGVGTASQCREETARRRLRFDSDAVWPVSVGKRERRERV